MGNNIASTNHNTTYALLCGHPQTCPHSDFGNSNKPSLTCYLKRQITFDNVIVRYIFWFSNRGSQGENCSGRFASCCPIVLQIACKVAGLHLENKYCIGTETSKTFWICNQVSPLFLIMATERLLNTMISSTRKTTKHKKSLQRRQTTTSRN